MEVPLLRAGDGDLPWSISEFGVFEFICVFSGFTALFRVVAGKCYTLEN
jgi:hypothetical protein